LGSGQRSKRSVEQVGPPLRGRGNLARHRGSKRWDLFKVGSKKKSLEKRTKVG